MRILRARPSECAFAPPVELIHDSIILERSILDAGKRRISRRAKTSGCNQSATCGDLMLRSESTGLQGQPAATVPVRDLAEARHFYQEVLGCFGGHGDTERIDFTLFGSPIVCRVGSKATPVSIVIDDQEWRALARRLRQHRADFSIAPCVRFSGTRFKEASLSFLDPSGNALEFRSSHHVDRRSRGDRKNVVAMTSFAVATALVWCWILLLAQKSVSLPDGFHPCASRCMP